eukprot:1082351-Prymnesium_polylepis.1
MSMRTSFGGTPNLSSTRQSMPISMSLAAAATLSFAVGGEGERCVERTIVKYTTVVSVGLDCTVR